ncbi:MAG TPA: methyltransferase domain-containing protein [Stellaceae bacterium]|nr:methyltransferase domain-containing protein [Stellaceae bacterium]
MTDVEAVVRGYYGRGNLLAPIEAGLMAAGVDPMKPRPQDLYPLDQMHNGGIVATREHAARAEIRPGMKVLDLGCGQGGPARYLAGECGCRVTGLDLTPEFIELARLLTARCGLAGEIEFHVGSALALPFAAASFDHVWCHNATMNITDKATLAREIARVLKRGGRMSCVELAQGPAGAPQFPLPWATDTTSSFLVSPAAMKATLEAAGLRVIEQLDFAAIVAKHPEQPRRENAFAEGSDFAVRLRNGRTGVQEKCLIDQLILAEKP